MHLYNLIPGSIAKSFTVLPKFAVSLKPRKWREGGRAHVVEKKISMKYRNSQPEKVSESTKDEQLTMNWQKEKHSPNPM